MTPPARPTGPSTPGSPRGWPPASGSRSSTASSPACTAGPGREPGDVRLHGVVLPGLANAHSHAFHRALRGRTHGDGGNFWTWRQQMYAVTRHLTPDTYLALARAVFAEMVLAGITVVGEFHYLHHDLAGRPYADPNAMGEAVIEAARDAGLRLTLLDTCYLAGGLASDGHLPLDEVQRRFTDGDVDALGGAGGGPRRPDATTRIGAAVHSVRAVPRDDLRADGRGDARSHRARPCERAAGREPRHPDVLRRHSHRAARRGRAAGRPVQRGPRHAPVRPRRRAARPVRRRRPASAPRPSATSPTASARPAPWPTRGRGSRSAPTSTRSSTRSRRCAGLEMHERLSSNERGRFTPDELIDAASVDGYRSLGWQDAG